MSDHVAVELHGASWTFGRGRALAMRALRRVGSLAPLWGWWLLGVALWTGSQLDPALVLGLELTSLLLGVLVVGVALRAKPMKPRTGVFELSVLFVDVRGYSGYAERRSPEEVFSTISAYTRNVSDVIARHGGSVIEFNGDGLLAIFGYACSPAHKEQAAVRAALQLVRSRDLARGLKVGVGIATGPAYVGLIRAIDRSIWSATGDTTNLAARLQCMARDLDAAIVLDSTTSARASAQSQGFVQLPGMAIRGRARVEDVFFLPCP